MKKGFTFMELLVVIAIIGILTAIAAASYVTAQKQTRDQRRVSDLKSLQNAWEQYFADNSQNYPANCSVDVSDYLPGGLPLDPKTAASYTMTCAAGSYCFCATMEQTRSTNAIDSSCTFGSGGYYCVKNVQ